MNQEHIQERFLNELRRSKLRATVITTNGFQLKGTVTGFDHYTLLVDDGERQNLVFKSAVSTIVRAEPDGT